ncbi:sigma-70 family RNA polymerase sigma factor [Candidatus Caldipriscus sp.]|nr:sigma-70 family RNA polymerase sigma factor [Candidatus Caldipriscus sp.]
MTRKGERDLVEILNEIVEEAKENKMMITFDKLLEKLPSDVVENDTLMEQVMIALMEKGVEIEGDLTSSTYKKKKTKRKQEVERIIRSEEEKIEREYKDDPVRTYLKEVAEMRLLSRNEELEYAKTIDNARTEITRILLGTYFGISKFMHLVQLAQKGLIQAEEIFQVDPGYWTNRVKNQKERKRLSKGIEYLLARWPVARRLFLEREKLSESEIIEAENAYREIVDKILEMGPVFTKMLEIYKEYIKKVDKLTTLYEERERLRGEKEIFKEIGAENFIWEYDAIDKGYTSRISKIEEELKQSYEEARKTADELIKLYKKYEYARNKLAEGNVRLVISEAKRYMNRGLDFGDLVQEGNLGLLKAIDKYDYKKGFKFSTYATWWIRQAITRAIADHSRTIRIPIHMIETITKINRAQKALLQEKGRQPSIEEIAEYLEMPISRVEKALSVAKEPLSMDKPIGSDGDTSLGEIIYDESTLSAEEELKIQSLRERLNMALKMLSPRERKVIELRFGLDGKKPRTLEEVAQEMNLTRERVRQLEVQALEKLRNPIRLHVLGRFKDLEEL